jgi:hypothetical protein
MKGLFAFGIILGIKDCSGTPTLGHRGEIVLPLRIPTIPRRDTDMITRIVPI